MRYASTGSPAASPSSRAPERRPRRRAWQRGFTLLETLIAMVVLALALTVLLQTYSEGLRAVIASDAHMKARLLAQSVLAEYAGERGTVPAPAQGRWESFEWRLAVAPAGERWAQLSNEPGWELFEIAVTVDWPPRGQLRLATLRLGKPR